jgi:hypothetical protein
MEPGGDCKQVREAETDHWAEFRTTRCTRIAEGIVMAPLPDKISARIS